MAVTDRIQGTESSVAIKAPVRVISTSNITLSGLQTIDTVAVVADDRAAVNGQSNPVLNGLWVVQPGAWYRALDFNGDRDVTQGTRVLVNEGSLAGDYILKTVSPRIGVTPIHFVRTQSGITDVTPQSFGAVGDGVADDSVAWAAFQAISSVYKRVPPGQYLVNGSVINIDNGAIGDANVTSLLTAPQKAQVSTGINTIIPREAQIIITEYHADQNIRPAVYVATTINDNSGAAFATKVGGIYSYIEQTGTNTNQYVKSICGVSVNAASGNNDSTGIVGYSYKLDVAGGIGDAAGGGGATYQYSTEEGLALGAEFSVHQNVPGTFSSANARSGNNSMALHITTNSTAARAWAAVGIDGQGLNAGRFSFWNGIVLSRSIFAAGGEGMGQTGTVGINFGNNTATGPEKAIYLGNAEYHLWRPGDRAIRMHGSSLDFENKDGGVPGVRLISPTDSPQGGYIAAYKGSTGADGTTTVTTTGSFVIGPDGYVSMQAYDGSGNLVTKVSVSPATNSFLSFMTSGTTGLGAPSRLWSQLFAATATINTSDERFKTDIAAIPDAVLDAWGDVGFAQYRFIDAVEAKGGAARLHTGVIAQRVVAAFAAHSLNAMDYGLLCYDEWEAEPDTVTTDRILTKHAVYEQVLVRDAILEDGVEIKGAIYKDGDLLEPEEVQEVVTTTPGIAAGNRYGIRYEEALCMEAAFQRRRADRIEARLARLETAVLGA